MRQMLLRVPDDLHARLTERASRSGRSANAIATEILDRELADESADRRAALRSRARRLGLLASGPSPRIPDADRQRIVAAMRGTGPVLDQLLAAGR